MSYAIVEVTVRLKVYGLSETAASFAQECVEEALQNSDEMQRCFDEIEVSAYEVERHEAP